MLDSVTVSSEVAQFIHYSAITGFIVVTTLIINLNHKAFKFILKDNAKKYWWLFVILAIIPLALILYAFTFMFGRFFI